MYGATRAFYVQLPRNFLIVILEKAPSLKFDDVHVLCKSRSNNLWPFIISCHGYPRAIFPSLFCFVPMFRIIFFGGNYLLHFSRQKIEIFNIYNFNSLLVTRLVFSIFLNHQSSTCHIFTPFTCCFSFFSFQIYSASGPDEGVNERSERFIHGQSWPTQRRNIGNTSRTFNECKLYLNLHSCLLLFFLAEIRTFLCLKYLFCVCSNTRRFYLILPFLGAEWISRIES